MMPTENEQLLGRLRSRDRSAFARLVRTHEQQMLRTAFRIVGQQSDAEEVRQSVLLRIWQSPEKLPEPQRLGSWLHRCVVNESIALLRRRKRYERRHVDSLEQVHLETQSTCEDEAELLRDAMSQLEPEPRAILSLRFDEQLTIREIASLLQQPHTTVQSKLERAIGRLRSHLETQVNAKR